MKIKYDLSITNQAIVEELQRLTNQIYKLLPIREEGGDCQKLLDSIILELVGMDCLLLGMHSELFPLMCKLEALTVLVQETDFFIYRKMIFECLTLVGVMIRKCQDTRV